MKMKKMSGMLIAMCLILLSGCSGSNHLALDDIEADTLYVSKEGSLELASVETFGEEYYSKKELKDFIEEAVDTYTSENGEDTVKMEDFFVKEDTAKVLLSFDSADTYSSFQGESLQFLTSEELHGKMVLPEQFTSAADGKKVDKDTVLAEKDLKYVVVNGTLDIQVDGVIKYYSEAMIISDTNVHTTGEDISIVIFS